MAIAEQRVSELTRSEHEAPVMFFRSELQSETTLAELGAAGNSKLNIAFNKAESVAFEEAQERRHEVAAAAQYKSAAANLDFQGSSLRARRIGHDSNLIMPAADDIARCVWDVLRPDQEQIARYQKRI